MGIDEITKVMSRNYNFETRKLQLQSEMDTLDLPYFMPKHQTTDNSVGLTKLADHISTLAPQLPVGFGDEMNKTRYLHCAE